MSLPVQPDSRNLPLEQSITFHRMVQRSRMGAMFVLAAVAALARATGIIDFDDLAAVAIFLIGIGSGPALLRLHRLLLDRGRVWNLHVAWISLDLLLVTWMIYLVRDASPLWLIWYLTNTAAAAFVLGRRAAHWTIAFSCVAYLALLAAMGKLSNSDQDLLAALGRLAILFGGTYFMVRGIADIREKRKEIQGLLEERSRRLTEFERLAHELDRRTQELAKANLQAEAASRAKSQFLASMSHELRTPLNSVLGFAEILRERLAGTIDPRLERFLDHIQTSGRHLLGLINDILDLSKIEAGKFELSIEPVSLEDVVRGVTSVIDGIARPRRIAIDIVVEPALPLLRADPPRLKQVLYNLLSNAIKFSPDDSAVRVIARRSTARESARHPAGLVLEVIDAGPGIRKEDQELIFEEFRQLDGTISRNMGGTGLGLALVKRFVELHGGAVEIDSELGRGSTFRVHLPLDGPRGSARQPDRPLSFGLEASEAISIVSDRPRRRILCIEDDDVFFEAFARDLRLAGYEVVRGATGEDAFTLARRLRPDAITLDLVLPGRDGWEILRDLKQDADTSSIPVLIVSLVANHELGFALGASDYFSKPLDREAFLARLADLVPATTVSERRRVLVIDDDEQVHDFLTHILEEANFQVLTAVSATEGLALAKSVRPRAIVLDLVMEELDGFEVASRLAADPTTRGIPLLVYTGKDLSPEDRQRLAGRLRSFVPKVPVNSKYLVETLDDLIRRSQREALP